MGFQAIFVKVSTAANKLIHKCRVHFMYIIVLCYAVLHIICNSICSICSNMVAINIMWLERKWAWSPIIIGADRKQKTRQNAMAELRTGSSWETNLTFVKEKKKEKNLEKKKKDKWAHHVGSEVSFLGIIQSWVAWKLLCHLPWCRIILSVW